MIFLGNCAFILPDLRPDRYHEFRVFTKNKYGDNYDTSFSIAVGKPKGIKLSNQFNPISSNIFPRYSRRKNA